MWTYLHFLKYDQNEHELITNEAIFIKKKIILPAGVWNKTLTKFPSDRMI